MQKGTDDSFTNAFLQFYLLHLLDSHFSPYTLPGKTINQNVCFIYQHGVAFNPYFAGKYDKFCWNLKGNRKIFLLNQNKVHNWNYDNMHVLQVRKNSHLILYLVLSFQTKNQQQRKIPT